MAKRKPDQNFSGEQPQRMDEDDIFQSVYGTGGSQPDVPKFDLPKPRNHTSAGKKPEPARKRKNNPPSGKMPVTVLILLLAVIIAGVLFGTAGTRTCIFGHVWVEATCEAPRLCRVCGETEGEALGHLPGYTSCTTPTVCLQCDMLLQEASGHTWRAASQDCIHCHVPFPASHKIPEDAAMLREEDVTHFYKVFAVSANQWAPNHYKQTAQLSVVNTPVTWDLALQLCQEAGGRMAEISSAEIQECVYTELVKSRYPGLMVYFGLTDQETEGEWKWLSGTDTGYQNWHDNQPDTNIYKNYACFCDYYEDGTWVTANFMEDIRYFVCEWILPNQ